MVTTVLDFTTGKVHFIYHDEIDDTEEYLIEEGFNTNNCQWMTTEELIIS